MGSWINQKDSQGNTSMLLSAYVGNISVMELLIENGGELNMTYNNKVQKFNKSLGINSHALSSIRTDR